MIKLSTSDLFKVLYQNGGWKVIKGKDKEELQKQLVEITNDIISFCDTNNYCIMMGGGTALGAIRHKGFIPWDDDIDLNMPRKDYNKFIEKFEEEYKDKYWVHTPQTTSNYGKIHTQIRKKGTVFRGYEDYNSKECGIYVDIFVIENTCNIKLFRYLHGMIAVLLFGIVSCVRTNRDHSFLLAHMEYGTQIYKSVKLKSKIGRLFRFFSLDRWVRISDHWNSLCQNSSSKMVTVPSGRKKYFGELRARSTMCETIRIKFENNDWPICRGYKSYLKNLYGDYRMVPDTTQRESHAVLELKFNQE